MSRAVSHVASSAITVSQPWGQTVGARVDGLDVKSDLNDETFALVEQAFLAHHVVSIPGQQLDAAALLAFSRRVGPIEPHVLAEFHHPEHPEILVLSNIVRDGKAVGLADAGTYWHSDLSYKAQPSRATILHALEIPPEGGDTLFVNLVAAYEGLSADMQQRLEGLQGEHNYAYRSDRLAASLGIRKTLTDAQRKATPPVVHPVVRTHPVSGRKALYINPGFTVRLLGLGKTESDELLTQLFNHCLRPAYRFRYKWQPGDLVLWDNAAVMHRATTRELDPSRHRHLWRTIVSGDAPF